MPAYNNYYPTLYPNYNYLSNQQPNYQPPVNMPAQTQPLPQTPNITQPITSGMIWVNNEQEAQNYLVAPNNAVALWDSNSPVVYVKQADASGRPFLKIYDLTERGASPDTSKKALEYAEKEEVTAMKADFESIRNEMKTIKKDVATLKRKRDDIDDE